MFRNRNSVKSNCCKSKIQYLGWTAKIKCKIQKFFKNATKFLTLEYFFFIITVNNIIFFINSPNDIEAVYTLGSPKISHITIFLIDALLRRRDVYYKGKSKGARRHLWKSFYLKMWCWLEGTLVRGSLLIEGFTLFIF